MQRGFFSFVLSAGAAALGTICVAAPDPYQLFAQARAYWDTVRYPAYLDYTVVVTVRDAKGAPRTERYRSAYNAVTGAIWVDPVSDYELAHPASGRGVDFGPPNRNPHPAPDQDFLGVPLLAPAYSFSIGHFVAMEAPHGPTDADLVAQVRAAFHDPDPRHATPAPAQSRDLRVIGSVVSVNHDYTVGFAGEETIDGHDCYHLTLQPEHVDGRYRLRDVWIDTKTNATVRARTALNFVDGPGTLVPWTIDFADVDGAHYVASERADRSVKYAKHTYSDVTIAFEGIHARTTPVEERLFPFSAFLVLREP